MERISKDHASKNGGTYPGKVPISPNDGDLDMLFALFQF